MEKAFSESVIRQIFDGPLFMPKRYDTTNPEYAALEEKLSTVSQKVRSELSDNEELFEEFQRADDEMTDHLAYENFRMGFKLGAKMMSELLADEK